MNAKTVTVVLATAAVLMTGVLIGLALQRPQPAAAPNQVPSTTTATPTPPPSSPQATPAETDPTAEGGPSPLPSGEVDAHDTSPGATPYSQTAEARQQWQPVVTKFGRAFTTTKDKDAARWRASLAPLVTEKVHDELNTVDLRNVPSGTFDSIEPAEFGEDKVAVLIHYREGWSLVTYLIIDGRSWRIYAYDRWEE